MNKNTTILYSIHLVEEEDEEDYVVDLDNMFCNQSGFYKDVEKLLEACKVHVSQHVVDGIIDFSKSYAAFSLHM